MPSNSHSSPRGRFRLRAPRGFPRWCIALLVCVETIAPVGLTPQVGLFVAKLAHAQDDPADGVDDAVQRRRRARRRRAVERAASTVDESVAANIELIQGSEFESDNASEIDVDDGDEPVEPVEENEPRSRRRSSSSSSSRRSSSSRDESGFDGRIGHLGFKTFGRNESISHVELFPYVISGDQMIFADVRGFVSNQQQFGGNIGAGYRRWIGGWDRVVGASLWYDGDDSTGELFHQLGLSLESYGDVCDVRANFYLPIDDAEKDFNITARNLRFAGNQVLFDRYREFGEAMEGLDLELGLTLPTEFGEEHNLRAYGGWYHFIGDAVPNVTGFRAGVEGHITEFLSTQVEVTDDDSFGTNVLLGVALEFSRGSSPTGSRAKKRSKRMRRYVRRNYNVIVSKHWDARYHQAAINPATGMPFTIQHASSAAGGPGAGTAEDPFSTVAAAQAAGSDILFVHADSVFNTPIVLNPGETIVGEGARHAFQLGGFGPFLLPNATGGTSLPLVQGVAGNAVTLESGSHFEGFTIDTPGGGGIVGNGVNGATVRNVEITNAGGAGVSLTNSTGTFAFSGVNVNNATGTGLYIDGGDASIAFSGAINNAAGRALVVENTTGGSVDLGGTSVNDVGGQGVLIDSTAGDVAVGSVTVQNPSTAGITVQDATGTTSFSTVDVTTANQTGLFVRNSTRVNVGDGTLTAVNAPAADVEGAEIDVSLTSVSADGGAFGLRIVNSPGSFVVTGSGGFGSGGLIQNTATGVVVDNAGTVAFQNLDLDANTVGVDAMNAQTLVLARGRVTNSAGVGLELLNIGNFEVSNSELSNNAGVTIRSRVDTLGSYGVTLTGNTIDSTMDAFDVATQGAGVGSTLTLLATNNRFTTTANNAAGLQMDWNGVVAAEMINNQFTSSGDSSTGVNIDLTSAADLARIIITNANFNVNGTNGAGVQISTLGPSQVAVNRNVFNLTASNGTGMNFSLAESAEVNLSTNLVTATASSGTGILFSSIDGPSNVLIEANRLDLFTGDALVDRGIVFTIGPDPINLFGAVNNIVTGATTPFTATVGGTNGTILVNGVATP